MNQTYTGYIKILVAMLIWGSVGVFVRLAEQPSQVVVFYRVLSASICMVPVLLYFREPLPQLSGRKWTILMASGAALGLNWIFFFKAVQTTTIANAILSSYTAPIIVTLLSPLLLKERLETGTWSAIILGFSGIVFMLISSHGTLTSNDLIGIGCGLATAFFYALMTILSKMLKEVPATWLVAIQTLVSVILLIPLIWGTAFPPLFSLAIMAMIGVIHTALALTLYLTGLKHVKVQHVGILSYLDPLSSVVFAAIFLGELPGWSTIVGGLLILASSYIVLRQKRTEENSTIDM